MEIVIDKLRSITEEKRIALKGGTPTYCYKVLLNNKYYKIVKKKRLSLNNKSDYIILLSTRSSLIYDIYDLEDKDILMNKNKSALNLLLFSVISTPCLAILIAIFVHPILTIPMGLLWLFSIKGYLDRKKVKEFLNLRIG